MVTVTTSFMQTWACYKIIKIYVLIHTFMLKVLFIIFDEQRKSYDRWPYITMPKKFLFYLLLSGTGRLILTSASSLQECLKF